MIRSGSAPDAVDRIQLTRIGKDVGQLALGQYVAVFNDLVGGRIERIARVVAGETADGVEAALDLYVSSAMLGAKRLADISVDAATLLRSGEPISAARMTSLLAEAEAVGAALQQGLIALS